MVTCAHLVVVLWDHMTRLFLLGNACSILYYVTARFATIHFSHILHKWYAACGMGSMRYFIAWIKGAWTLPDQWNEGGSLLIVYKYFVAFIISVFYTIYSSYIIYSLAILVTLHYTVSSCTNELALCLNTLESVAFFTTDNRTTFLLVSVIWSRIVSQRSY